MNQYELFELRRRVDFIGAYNLVRPEPHKNYGIHNMVIRFAVIGAKGAASINMSTGWYLPQDQLAHVRMMTKGYPWDPEDLAQPNITDVGYHARAPQYEDQWSHENCELIDGTCYYDGTSLWGNEAWRLGFLHGGTEWLWPRLEQYYNHRFHDAELPDLTPVPRLHPDDRKAIS